MNSLRILALGIALSSSALAADVLVVDPGGGSPYINIGAALVAASPGDVILVRPGDYDLLAIFTSVSIIAEIPGTVTLGKPTNVTPFTALHVANLAPGGPVLLSGLNFRASTGTDPVEAGNAAVRVEQCLAPVIFQDCKFIGGRPGLFATQSVGVAIDRSEFDAANASTTLPGSNANAGYAIRAVGAAMILHRCSLQGGHGSSLHAPSAALHDFGSFVYAQDCEVSGGNAAAATPGQGGVCTNGSDGAPAVVLELGPPFHRVGGTITGGTGGAASGPPCTPGATGPSFQILSGLVIDHPWIAPSVRLPAWQHEGTADFLQVTGEPGSSALLLVGPTPGYVSSPAYGGALRIAPTPLFPISLGTLPISGSVSIPYALPLLPSGVDFASVQVQVATFGTSSAALGGARSFHVIDSSIP